LAIDGENWKDGDLSYAMNTIDNCKEIEKRVKKKEISINQKT